MYIAMKLDKTFFFLNIYVLKIILSHPEWVYTIVYKYTVWLLVRILFIIIYDYILNKK